MDSPHRGALAGLAGAVRALASRFYRWPRAGVWQKLFDTLKPQADADGRLNGLLHFVDSTIIRAHQHAAGAKRGTQPPKP
jgi:transposase